MKGTDNSNTTTNLIFGIRPIIEAVEGGKEIDRIFVQKGLSSTVFGELQEVLKKHQIAYKQVPIEKLNRLTRKNHQGVVAFISPISLFSLEDMVAKAFEKESHPMFMILDRVTDVRNFGAIVRTAECAGISGIVIPDNQSAPINGDAMKTSTGALSRVPIAKVPHLLDAIYYFKGSDVQIIGCTEKTSDEIYAPDFSKSTAIIMGSEENGISPAIMKHCDGKAKIPMMGSIGSLNVSVASGIILYEAVRQRLNS